MQIAPVPGNIDPAVNLAIDESEEVKGYNQIKKNWPIIAIVTTILAAGLVMTQLRGNDPTTRGINVAGMVIVATVITVFTVIILLFISKVWQPNAPLPPPQIGGEQA